MIQKWDDNIMITEFSKSWLNMFETSVICEKLKLNVDLSKYQNANPQIFSKHSSANILHLGILYANV